MISIIAAVGQNNELGKDNALIWNLPNDLKFFKKMTINHPVIMGKHTFNSIGHPLPNRYNIVISTSLEASEGVEVVRDFESILDRFLNSPEEVFIIGGSSLYHFFTPYASKIYLTEIEATAEADVYFPEFDKSSYDARIIDEDEENGIKYKHILYKR